MVARIGDIKISGMIQGNRRGSVQLDIVGRAAIAAEALLPACHGGDYAIRDLADAVDRGVCDVEVARRVRRQPERKS
jgi:hypothetical protein